MSGKERLSRKSVCLRRVGTGNEQGIQIPDTRCYEPVDKFSARFEMRPLGSSSATDALTTRQLCIERLPSKGRLKKHISFVWRRIRANRASVSLFNCTQRCTQIQQAASGTQTRRPGSRKSTGPYHFSRDYRIEHLTPNTSRVVIRPAVFGVVLAIFRKPSTRE